MQFDYSNSENLRVRRDLYSRFSSQQTSWNSWIVAEIVAEARPLSILDIGAGYGSVWTDFNSSFATEIVVTDISPGMLRDAPSHLGRVAMCAEQLAVGAASFDVVTAFSVLYHVEQRGTAFREIVRVLKPNGTFIFTTTGSNHLLELREVIQDNAGLRPEPLVASAFPLDEAQVEARRHFSSVKTEVFPECLVVNCAEALVDYVRSTPLGNVLSRRDFDAIEKDLKFRCSVGSGFAISTQSAKFVCAGPHEEPMA